MYVLLYSSLEFMGNDVLDELHYEEFDKLTTLYDFCANNGVGQCDIEKIYKVENVIKTSE